MYDTRTILCCNIISGDYAERLILGIYPITIGINLYGLNPRDKLLVVHTYQLGALPVTYNLERNELVARLVILQSDALCLLVEVSVEQWLGQYGGNLLACVAVVCTNCDIINLRTHAECGIRRQGPRCCGPCQEYGSTPTLHLGLWLQDAELRHHGGILNIAVAARLVQLVSRKTRTGCGRVGLNGVTLIEQALVVELLQKPPQSFDIFVIVGDIWVIHIHPITHLFCEVLPHIGELHHRLAAGAVILLD